MSEENKTQINDTTEDTKETQNTEAKKSDLQLCQEQCAQLENSYKRAVADLQNYKKEELTRTTALIGYAKEGFFENLLPILDSIHMASQAFGKDNFTPIEKQIQEFLKKEGIEEIEALGKPFNPEFMEIVSEEEAEGEAHTVLAELQKGYKFGGKVLRPARVKVSK